MAKRIEKLTKDNIENNGGKRPSSTGTGVALGASLGAIFGLLVLDNLALGAALGVMIGIVISAIADAQSARRQ